MSAIGQIHSSVYTTAYEPNSRTAKESKVKKDENVKDSVALSNKVSAGTSSDVNIIALKRIVDSHADIRAEKIAKIKPQIENGTYSLGDKIDKISDSIIYSLFA
ncbi:MAG: flagellar biosynthesis anti-sigma factor FlgM [Chitinivibrionia bacterium]|jgi:anti-sigma28 factor (negative regulator of flagellin synthesis)|nr:flagellar biosynthesis anti-sigma factor FlgM [Chitinivibrionia bacterium]